MWATISIISFAAIFHHEVKTVATLLIHSGKVVFVFACFFKRELDLVCGDGNVGVRQSYLKFQSKLVKILECHCNFVIDLI
jgi:hypothetical protein